MTHTDTLTLVREYRMDDRKLRTMERNVRLHRYQGRNATATGRKMDALERRVLEIEQELMGMGEHRLAGNLRTEAMLARRVSEGRDNGQQRPELRERLRYVRRLISSRARA